MIVVETEAFFPFFSFFLFSFFFFLGIGAVRDLKRVKLNFGAVVSVT